MRYCVHSLLSFYCVAAIMKSYGYEISDAIIVAGLTAMKGQFTALNVEGALCRAGCPDGAIPSRVADKLLQRERKAGRIKFENGKWSAIA
jgi:hypothetical protein